MVLAGGTILAFSIAQEVDAIRLIGPLGKGAFYHARLGQGWVVKLTGLSELADAFEGSGSKGLGAAQKEEGRGGGGFGLISLKAARGRNRMKHATRLRSANSEMYLMRDAFGLGAIAKGHQ